MTDTVAHPDDTRAERHALAFLIAMVIVGRLHGGDMGRQVPFLPWLEHVVSLEQWTRGLACAWWIGVLLICTPWFRAGALLGGGAELMRILGNMPAFSNGRTFDALLLIMVGLSSAAIGLRWLRAQYLLLYVGAGLNKLTDIDWWNGDFMWVTLNETSIGSRIATIPAAALVLGWLSMTIEIVIPVMLATRRWRAAGVRLCLLFHSAMLVVLREDFGTFYYAVSIGAVLLFYPFPLVNVLSMPPRAAVVLQRLSSLSAIRNAPSAAGPRRVQWGRLRLEGRDASALLFACTMPVQGIIVLLVTSASRAGWHTLREAVLCTLLGIATVGALYVRRRGAHAPEAWSASSPASS